MHNFFNYAIAIQTIFKFLVTVIVIYLDDIKLMQK